MQVVPRLPCRYTSTSWSRWRRPWRWLKRCCRIVARNATTAAEHGGQLANDALAQVALSLAAMCRFFCKVAVPSARAAARYYKRFQLAVERYPWSFHRLVASTPEVFRTFAANPAPGATDELSPDSDRVPANDLAQAAARAYPELQAYLDAVGDGRRRHDGSGSTCVVPGHAFELPAELPGRVIPCWTVASVISDAQEVTVNPEPSSLNRRNSLQLIRSNIQWHLRPQSLHPFRLDGARAHLQARPGSSNQQSRHPRFCLKHGESVLQAGACQRYLRLSLPATNRQTAPVADRTSRCTRGQPDCWPAR